MAHSISYSFSKKAKILFRHIFATYLDMRFKKFHLPSIYSFRFLLLVIISSGLSSRKKCVRMGVIFPSSSQGK